jgi:flavin-binding protein dodecin
MSPAEIRRAFVRVDEALRSMVTQDAWSRENNHLRELIGKVDQDCHERSDDVEEAAQTAIARAEKRTDDLAKATSEAFKTLDTRGQNTWGRIATVLGLVVSLVGLLWAVYASSKGIK